MTDSSKVNGLGSHAPRWCGSPAPSEAWRERSGLYLVTAAAGVMKEIRQYEIAGPDVTIEIPQSASFLTCQLLRTYGTTADRPLAFWCLVDPNSVVVSRRFVSVPNGPVSPALAGLNYLGTFQPHPGLVFHLFGDILRVEGT